MEGIRLSRVEATLDGAIVPIAGSSFTLPVESIVLAIGQAAHRAFLNQIQMEGGRIAIDRATGQTTHRKFFAGGDCTNGGREVVDAVADGKRAALGIAVYLEAGNA